jgi:16S rRNA (cytidine1402-2'-O)-methyltransferase
MLSIIATPIGNLKDITIRSLEVLQSCDGVICEDTRRSSQLLAHYQINKPFLILNDFNEGHSFGSIIEKLQQGQNLVLISDAGTPLISDPGYKLVRECLTQGVEVDSLPGPSAPITALTLSGLAPDKFIFWGYLPDKPGHRSESYQKIKSISQITPITHILFVAPFKIKKTLEEIKESLGDIEITLAKELTKIHQKVRTQKISEWLDEFRGQPKGEYVMLLRLVP